MEEVHHYCSQIVTATPTAASSKLDRGAASMRHTRPPLQDSIEATIDVVDSWMRELAVAGNHLEMGELGIGY